jgi:hypothetical protein
MVHESRYRRFSAHTILGFTDSPANILWESLAVAIRVHDIEIGQSQLAWQKFSTAAGRFLGFLVTAKA